MRTTRAQSTNHSDKDSIPQGARSRYSRGMASPVAGTCLDRERLVREFKDANEELVRIHTDEINAAMQGSLSAALSLHDELAMARKRRDRAAEELKHHLKQHGC